MTSMETARLEIEGAEQRLEHAVRALTHFQRIFGAVDDAGKFTFRVGIDAELLASLERELRELHVEVDDAARNLAHTRGLISEQRARQSREAQNAGEAIR
jgi:hypothetical protein